MKALALGFFASACFAQVSGVGSGTVQVTSQPNLGPARSATIIFSDANGAVIGTSVVNQDSGCGWHLSSTAATFAMGGGNGAVFVTASDPACPAWTAVSNVSWITRTIGSASLTYTVAKNPGNSKARTGTITIAGQLFTVTQAGKR